MDKESVLWGLEALGNSLSKSSSLEAGGDGFQQFPSWDGADLLGVLQRVQEGPSHATGMALGGCARDFGGTRSMDKEGCAFQEPSCWDSWSQGSTKPCSPWLPWDEGCSDDVLAEGPHVMAAELVGITVPGAGAGGAVHAACCFPPPDEHPDRSWLKMSFEW